LEQGIGIRNDDRTSYGLLQEMEVVLGSSAIYNTAMLATPVPAISSTVASCSCRIGQQISAITLRLTSILLHQRVPQLEQEDWYQE
jgi:hypothetical protein